MKSLVHGVPMILVPIPDHTRKQYSNAKRAEFLGVAKVIDQNKVNADTLDSALVDVLTEKRYKKSAKKIQNRHLRLVRLKPPVTLSNTLHWNLDRYFLDTQIYGIRVCTFVWEIRPKRSRGFNFRPIHFKQPT